MPAHGRGIVIHKLRLEITDKTEKSRKVLDALRDFCWSGGRVLSSLPNPSKPPFFFGLWKWQNVRIDYPWKVLRNQQLEKCSRRQNLQKRLYSGLRQIWCFAVLKRGMTTLRHGIISFMNWSIIGQRTFFLFLGQLWSVGKVSWCNSKNFCLP